MPAFRPLADPARRLLAGHLGTLRGSLDRLGGRLREAIARAVGRAAADAVREAVRALLSELPDGTPRQSAGPTLRPPPGLARPLWGHHEEDEAHGLDDDPRSPWDDEGEDEHWPEEGLDDAPSFVPSPPPLPAPPRPLRWLSALAAGWRAALWWLRRQSGRRPLLAALGVGLAAGAVALAPGPLAGLAGAALGLVALADAARCGVGALAGALGP